MNQDAIKHEPMVVDARPDEMSQPQGQQQAQEGQQQHPLQQQILQQPQQIMQQPQQILQQPQQISQQPPQMLQPQQILQQQQPQQIPPQQPLQPQQQQQQQQHESVPSFQQPLDENDRGSDQSMQHSSNTSQEPNTDSQKLPTFSGVNNAPQTMTKGNILEAIKDFDSSIPDAVVHHFLNVAGMQTSDQRIVRLIAIAAQKLIHDIVSDSLQHCKLRGAQNKKTKEKKYTLTMEDLGSALAEYGIEVNRPLYFN